MPKDENRYTKMRVLTPMFYTEPNPYYNNPQPRMNDTILLCPVCAADKELGMYVSGQLHQHEVVVDKVQESVSITYWCEFHQEDLMTLHMNQHKGATNCYWDEHFTKNPNFYHQDQAVDEKSELPF